MRPAELPEHWRTRAGELRAHAAEGAALAYEKAAGELEAALAAVAGEVLTLAEAALASGYSADHLRKELAAGRLPNAGKKHAPAIRRADLPRKAGHVPADADAPERGGGRYDLGADVRALHAKLDRPNRGPRRGAA